MILLPAVHTVFQCTISGDRVPVSLRISPTYETWLDFNIFSTHYMFHMVRWSQRGFAEFVEHFFNQARDAGEFGTYEEHTAQKLNIITQGAKDIMRCVDRIITCTTQCERSVQDYAVWYKSAHSTSTLENYEEYITYCACDCMIIADFLTPDSD